MNLPATNRGNDTGDKLRWIENQAKWERQQGRAHLQVNGKSFIYFPHSFSFYSFILFFFHISVKRCCCAYTWYAEIQRKKNTVRGSQLYVDHSNVEITQKKTNNLWPLLQFWLKLSCRIENTCSHTNIGTHDLFLRELTRKLQNGKMEKELRDHFSTTEIFTKPKNTHGPNPPI